MSVRANISERHPSF